MVWDGRLIVCSVACFFGSMAVVLSVAAQFTQSKVLEDCLNEKASADPSLVLGMVAATFLSISQLLLTTCCCCYYTPSTSQAITISTPNDTKFKKRTKALLSIALSWICFGIAFFVLVEGVFFKQKKQSYNDSAGASLAPNNNNNSTCYMLKPHIFAAGAALALLSTLFAIVYYITLTSSQLPNPLHPHQTRPHQIHPLQTYPCAISTPPQLLITCSM